MTCPAYGSSSNMALYYAVDSDPAAALPGTMTWTPVPVTSESLAATLTSSISEQINATRSYANSVVTQGEVSGSFGVELEASTFMDAMLQAVLQASGTWTAGSAIQNGQTTGCFAFLKTVLTSAGTDYYVFRGCQIDSLSMSVSPGSFISGEVAVMGTRQGAGAIGATDGSNDILQALPGGWTLGSTSAGNLMSSVFALQDFEVQTAGSVDVGVIIKELSLSFSNQLRQQFAVGTGTPYAAGVASGRFQATLTGNAYYSGPAIINGMLSDDELKVVFNIVDADGAGWGFLFDKVKVTSAPPPAASGPDQDVMSSTEFQAFQSLTHGTVEITKITGSSLGSEALTNGTFASNITSWVGTDWAWNSANSGEALHTAGTTDALMQAIAITSGTTYEVTFTMAARTAGNVSIMLGNQVLNVSGSTTFSSNATYTGRIVANQSATVAFSIVPSSLFDGAITTVSVKPVVWS